MEENFFLIPPPPLLSFLFIPVLKEICQNSSWIQAKETRTSETTYDEEYRHYKNCLEKSLNKTTATMNS